MRVVEHISWSKLPLLAILQYLVYFASSYDFLAAPLLPPADPDHWSPPTSLLCLVAQIPFYLLSATVPLIMDKLCYATACLKSQTVYVHLAPLHFLSCWWLFRWQSPPMLCATGSVRYSGQSPSTIMPHRDQCEENGECSRQYYIHKQLQ
ncbi:hypothetical protein KIPB_000576 [Kipferlia bialata]|uniref:Uncharacterized protein n=1 Tax=Kipferlia bialata TaxID=797122 RepID=A0A9K3GEI5_9EUKA|nr:hypothetical protein KIPB_000576 [Kipferlia bialata]|eukprot:g576.t1